MHQNSWIPGLLISGILLLVLIQKIPEVWNCSVSSHTDHRCAIKLTSLISTFYIETFFGCVCNMLINDGVVFLHFILVVCVRKKGNPPVRSPFSFCLKESGAAGAQHWHKRTHSLKFFPSVASMQASQNTTHCVPGYKARPRCRFFQIECVECVARGFSDLNFQLYQPI